MRYLILLFSFFCLDLNASCDFTFVDNECVLEIYCNGEIHSSFDLQTITWKNTSNTTFQLRDGSDNKLTGSINDAVAFATPADLFAFIAPLKAACGSAGAMTAVIEQFDKELICLEVGADTIQAWHYTYRTGAGALSYETRRSDDNTIVAGNIVACVADISEPTCQVLGESGLDRVTGTTMTYPANTVHSISILVRSGTVNVIIQGGASVPINAGEYKEWHHPDECEYLIFEHTFDGSGGAVFDITTIK